MENLVLHIDRFVLVVKKKKKKCGKKRAIQRTGH